MVNYNCRKIFFAILKRWYVILVVVAVFGSISVPLSNFSRANVEMERYALSNDNYNVDATFIKEQGSPVIYMACLQNNEIMDNICLQHKTRVEWGTLSGRVKYMYDYDGDILEIHIEDATKEEISIIIDASTEWLSDFLYLNGASSFIFHKQSELRTPLVLDLVNEPNAVGNRIKIISTAMIMGGVLACIIIMFLDYKKECRALIG